MKLYLVFTLLLVLFGAMTTVTGSDCICTQEFDPVCGTNGVTYGNPCKLYCAGAKLAYRGPCRRYYN